MSKAKDARILWNGNRAVASVYMAGYLVECNLKALLKSKGRKLPTSGRKGHNLRGLIEAAGMKASDFHGFRRAFLERWSTDLRYESSYEDQCDPGGLYNGAIGLAGYLKKQIKRTRRSQ